MPDPLLKLGAVHVGLPQDLGPGALGVLLVALGPETCGLNAVREAKRGGQAAGLAKRPDLGAGVLVAFVVLVGSVFVWGLK